MLKKIFISVCLFLLVSSATSASGDIETETSPNYLVVLVHGVNTPGFIFRGHGERGSEVSDIPDNLKGFGDLLGYLNTDLSLNGYVYYYTFSQRDGRIADLARELGDRNYDNPAALSGSIMNYKKLTDQPDISSSSYPELRRYLRYPSPNDAEPQIVGQDSSGKGNSWLEQAREDFKVWFKTSGPGSKNDPPREPTEAEIPQKYILICHSMGGYQPVQLLFQRLFAGLWKETK